MLALAFAIGCRSAANSATRLEPETKHIWIEAITGGPNPMYLAVFDDETALFGVLRGKSRGFEGRRSRLTNEQMLSLAHAMPFRSSVEGLELSVPLRQPPCDASDARSMEIHVVMHTILVLQDGPCAPDAALRPLHDAIALVMTALASR